jgi:hypothetical protein
MPLFDIKSVEIVKIGSMNRKQNVHVPCGGGQRGANATWCIAACETVQLVLGRGLLLSG